VVKAACTVLDECDAASTPTRIPATIANSIFQFIETPTFRSYLWISAFYAANWLVAPEWKTIFKGGDESDSVDIRPVRDI
jgi:hypothetical protein